MNCTKDGKTMLPYGNPIEMAGFTFYLRYCPVCCLVAVDSGQTNFGQGFEFSQTQLDAMVTHLTAQVRQAILLESSS